MQPEPVIEQTSRDPYTPPRIDGVPGRWRRSVWLSVRLGMAELPSSSATCRTVRRYSSRAAMTASSASARPGASVGIEPRVRSAARHRSSAVWIRIGLKDPPSTCRAIPERRTTGSLGSVAHSRKRARSGASGPSFGGRAGSASVLPPAVGGRSRPCDRPAYGRSQPSLWCRVTQTCGAPRLPAMRP